MLMMVHFNNVKINDKVDDATQEDDSEKLNNYKILNQLTMQ